MLIGNDIVKPPKVDIVWETMGVPDTVTTHQPEDELYSILKSSVEEEDEPEERDSVDMVSLEDYNRLLSNGQALQKEQYKILHGVRAAMDNKDWVMVNQIYQNHKKVHTELTLAPKELLDVDHFL